MEMYKCVVCGITSPLRNGNNVPLAKNRKCYRCGSTKDKVIVNLPRYPNTKRGKRARFFAQGKRAFIRRIGV